jgi:hypothetical protein
MRRLAVILLVVILAAGCSRKEEKTVFKVPGDYKSWKKPVEEVMDYEIPGHGKTFRVIYANSTSFNPEIIKRNNGTERIVYREGSIFIKEVYERQADVGNAEPFLTIMKKESKNSMAVNGWVYFAKKPGKDQEIISTRKCVGCHESANEQHPYFDRNEEGLYRDYIFVPVNK